MAEKTPPVIPKTSFPVPASATGTEFSTAADLLQSLDREASGLYLVGGKGMWHGGIHITDTTAPWCALTGNAPPELAYAPAPHKGEQHLRCMADGDIVAFRVCKEYPTIPWEEGTLYLSGSFVLVRHYVQPGTTADSGLTFYTLYMHLAPYSAYASQTDPRQRITKGGVKFYLTKEDVASNKVAGKFSAGNVVTLCDETMVRSSDNHQFSQVKMQDGRLVWTVSDGGFLKMAESNGASPPPWWSQCSPAYNVTPPTAAVYKNKTALNYYRCSEDVVFETVVSGQNKKWGKPAGKLLPVNTQMTMETDNAAQTVTRPDNRIFKLMTMTADVAGTPLKRGERVWVVADGDNLEAVAAPAGAAPKFDEVVIPATPVAIQAGAALGHLGFFQIPTETGFRSRYMVHIECLTSDSKVASFLTNPEAAGRESPAFLKYPADAKLFSKDAKGAMAESSRKTKAPGILTLSNVPAVSADGIPTHYQIRPEGGFLAASSVEKLSQFDLGKLGFSIIKDDPESFQLLDAENQPQNVVKGIFEKLKAAAEDDPAFSNALASHQYKQLLDVIDQNHDGYYSVDEYRNAVHNPAYRDRLYQLIVQHPSEWYYEKTDAKWTKYLEKLEPDASKWKKYTEAFLDKMIWMKKVADMGPAPWHMHPVMFMGALKPSGNYQITVELVELLLGHKNPWFTGKSGGKVFAESFKNNHPDMYMIDKNEFISSLNSIMTEYQIVEPYQKAHFLSQCLHESAHFDTTLEYGSGSNYDLGRHPDAATYENTEVGDGPKYRGRGLIQLTWKKNYRIFSDYAGINFVSSPDDIAKNKEYAIRASCWFWRKNGGIHKKYNAQGDINILIANEKNNVTLITKSVNGGDNGLEERKMYFEKIKNHWGLNDEK
ncbi:glycoside hydrolase family 19 protein [Rahnella bonaserana]|uniref:glycoside hydrolase family 19 protein n=1 Tax=Rahnella bonaserana TaxID=2816248 RepID=UPI001EE5C025|nr:glycoside hydrolase family 19 protein [Rahnella bonaserana]